MTTDRMLRLVTDDELTSLDRDAATAEIQERWTDARHAYNRLIGVVGDPSLRHLIVPPHSTMRRADMSRAHHRARELARHAVQLADELDRAVAVWDRYMKDPS